MINDLLAQCSMNLSDVEIRIRRAADPTGSTYQESRWRPSVQTAWTWDFDAGSGYAVAHEILAGSPGGPFLNANSNTRDTAGTGNDIQRIFTWAWDGHRYVQGFSFGSAVTDGANNTTSFLWEHADENHAIPYTEIYLRRRTDVPAAELVKLGSGTLTLSENNTYAGPTVIRGGTLVVASDTALGTAGSGTAVYDGGTLALTGGVTVAGEALAVYAALADGPDHLVNLAGTNTWTGRVTRVAPTSTTVALFTGGDLGEGLDLEGTMVYAVNIGGTAAGPVRGVTFTSSEASGTPGFAITAPSVIPNWFTPAFGDTADDDALEAITQSIRHAGAQPGVVRMSLANLTPGHRYKLQLLVDELPGTINRGFDVFIDGLLAVDNFSTAASNPAARGAVITHEFLASNEILSISLDGTATAFADRNPIINAVTLEDLGPAPGASVRLRSEGGRLNVTGQVRLGPGTASLVVGGSGDMAISGAIDGAAYAGTVLGEGAVGYWRLGETSLPRAEDLAGTRDGTYVNLAVSNLGHAGAILGDPDTSVRFTAGDQYVEVGDDGGLNSILTGDYTVQFWMYKESEAGDWQRLVGKGAGSNRTFGVWEESGAGKRLLYQIYVSGGSGLNLYSNTGVEVGRWYHVAVTKQGNVGRIYINGRLDAAGVMSGTINTDTSPLTIGRAPTLHTTFPGRLDEVALFDRALNETEIRWLYDAGLARSHDLVKQGPGTLTLSGENRYEGGTAVMDGVLLVSNTSGSGTGSGDVVVHPGATLGGTGNVGGPVVVDAGGTISPGSSPGALSVGRAGGSGVQLAAGSTLRVELAGPAPGSGYDQLKVRGSLDLGGSTLSLSRTYAPAVNDPPLVLVDNDGTDPILGQFAGLPEGALINVGGLPFTISYCGGTGNDVVLTRVPVTVQQVVYDAGINDTSDDVQRSIITRIQITLTGVVQSIDPGAIAVTRTGAGGGPVNLAWVNNTSLGYSVIEVTFRNGNPFVYNRAGVLALNDGNYRLDIDGDKLRDASGSTSPDRVDHFFRFFGDTDGDRDVDGVDLYVLRRVQANDLRYLRYRVALDYNGDGLVDALDYNQFRTRYGRRLLP